MEKLMNKYSIEHKTIDNVLGYINDKTISIPEMQRPFVWKNTQVRDLIDSLYEGYPVGYLVIWQNPDVRDKTTGELSVGKQILIDGQQRVTALMAAICGQKVLDDDFEEKNITIAFNPFPAEGENHFEVKTAATDKDKRWIPDISVLFRPEFSSWDFVNCFHEMNPQYSHDAINKAIQAVIAIRNQQIGVIILNKDLGIDVVTEIFIRINSKGTTLNQADFVMSTIAADEKYGGNLLRKSIDYFCHLVANANFLSQMDKDTSFKESEFYKHIQWVSQINASIYNPTFDDVIRVAFTSQYDRGKLANLVDLLHGRNFKTQTYEDAIIEESFAKFAEGVKSVQNQYNMIQFQEALKSAGFIKEDMLRSRMAIDFAYALFLRLRNDASVEKTKIPHYVAKWYALSVLTGRYTGSPETAMDKDLRNIKEKGFQQYLEETQANISDTFWDITAPQQLQSSSTTSPMFLCFLAAQCKASDDAFLASGGKVRDLLESGDVHHLFPKDYLKKAGIDDKNRYNQVANYALLTKAVNISIGKKAPAVYMQEILGTLRAGQASTYTNLTSIDALQANLKTNCIPDGFAEMDCSDYDRFLDGRRKLMSARIRSWFENL